MDPVNAAAIVYAAVSAGVIAFQLALGCGAPWGAYAMGGAYPGRFPAGLRLAALAQAVLIAAMAGVVLARADLALPQWAGAAEWLIWAIIAFAAVSVVLNAITPSAGERRIWLPVALLMLVCSLAVATGRPA